METRENTVRKEVSTSAISVDKVYKSEYQKEGTETAQLRQVVKTDAFYPSKQVGHNLQNNVFSLAEFGFEETKHTNEETRVAWINVPEGVSADDVLARLPENATLYRMLSNRPILSESQQYSIDSAQKTMDDYADAQVVRYSANHEKAGQIVLDANGKPQYRAIFFWAGEKEDIDLRTEDGNDLYQSPTIKAELMGAATIVNQDL